MGSVLHPSIGWFISDKTAVVGVPLNINPNGQKTTYEENGSTYQSDKSNGFNIGLGGFVRNYFSGKSALDALWPVWLEWRYQQSENRRVFLL